MKENVRLAMKQVAGGKITYALLNDGKSIWLDRLGEKLPPRGYETLRHGGLVRMEKLDEPPEGTKAWFRVLLSTEGRRIWMPERDLVE